MFSESAELYDLIYAAFKDFAAEAAELAGLLRRAHPECRTVLDVGCGTGEHARHLAEAHDLAVDGLDLEPAFVEIARRKNPGGEFVVADMADFRLAKRYDAVVCLFSSIGYVRTSARVVSALRCFGEHLAPDGVVVVEPWFAPGQLDPDRVSRHTAEAEGIRVERVSRVEVDGALSRLRFDYTIREGGTVRTATEIHELGLFTTEELLESFRQAGLRAEYDPEGLTGRGLYTAHR